MPDIRNSIRPFARLGARVATLAATPGQLPAVQRMASKANAVAVKTRTSSSPSGPTGGPQFDVGGGAYYSPRPGMVISGYSGGGYPVPFGAPGGGGYGAPGGNQLTAADFAGAVAAAVDCEGLSSPWKEICRGTEVLLGKPGTTASGSGLQVPQQVPPCPPGSNRVGNTCVAIGDAFPGGAPLFQEAGGQALVGAFGLPALSPSIVGSVANNRGEMAPIRRCPRGMVLGFDELCYPKAVLPRRSRFRKHKGERKPPMSGADAHALRRIGSLKKRVKELATDAGLSCNLSRRKK